MTIADLTRVRWLLGVLLIAAAALFAIGVASESGHHNETEATVESGEQNEATEHTQTTEHNEQTDARSRETVFGINLESTPLVLLAVVVSVALAVATWRADHRLVLLAAVLFAAAFAVLDVAEFTHQIRESVATIAVIAAIIAVLHAVAALLAEQRRVAAR